MLHANCRNAVYLHSAVRRFSVPDQLVAWAQPFVDYAPPNYEAPVLQTHPPWADPTSFAALGAAPQWNALDGRIDRRSHTGRYTLVGDPHRPQNPAGRTGLRGRGLLGRWGPNHAADPIITRWRKTEAGCDDVHAATQRRILQMVAIRRRDTGQWAIPGGMVDPGETVSQTLRREFAEEALNSGGAGGGGVADPAVAAQLEAFFATGGVRIFAGYVDDPRNTDDAWMETVACWFHDADGRALAGVRLEAGDDAGAVRWMDVAADMRLYASHADMVATVAQRAGAHW